MNTYSIKNICLLALCLVSFSTISNAQDGDLVINQDDSITTLLEMKKEINRDEDDGDRYKIQLYYGNMARAISIKEDFDSSFMQWRSKRVYETPNHKIWVGSFRTRLEAERALIKIKKSFSSAFIFKPKKD